MARHCARRRRGLAGDAHRAVAVLGASAASPAQASRIWIRFGLYHLGVGGTGAARLGALLRAVRSRRGRARHGPTDDSRRPSSTACARRPDQTRASGCYCRRAQPRWHCDTTSGRERSSEERAARVENSIGERRSYCFRLLRLERIEPNWSSPRRCWRCTAIECAGVVGQEPCRG